MFKFISTFLSWETRDEAEVTALSPTKKGTPWDGIANWFKRDPNEIEAPRFSKASS